MYQLGSRVTTRYLGRLFIGLIIGVIPAQYWPSFHDNLPLYDEHYPNWRSQLIYYVVDERNEEVCIGVPEDDLMLMEEACLINL